METTRRGFLGAVVGVATAATLPKLWYISNPTGKTGCYEFRGSFKYTEMLECPNYLLQRRTAECVRDLKKHINRLYVEQHPLLGRVLVERG